MMQRGCTRCKDQKKGCDRARPCARCSNAGITAAQCIESSVPSRKRSAAGPAQSSRATKRVKKLSRKARGNEGAEEESESDDEGLEEVVDAENDDEESESDEESENDEEGENDEDEEGESDEQPDDELIYDEGDKEQKDENGEDQDRQDVPDSNLTFGPEEPAPLPAQQNPEVPYYPVVTYSACTGRGFRIPIKTHTSIAHDAEE